MTDERLILFAIRLAVAAGGCRIAARSDPRALANLNACANRYSAHATRLLAEAVRGG